MEKEGRGRNGEGKRRMERKGRVRNGEERESEEWRGKEENGEGEEKEIFIPGIVSILHLGVPVPWCHLCRVESSQGSRDRNSA